MRIVSSVLAAPASTSARLAAGLVAILFAGCGDPPPQLVPVTGRVVRKGELPISAGAIYFHPDIGNGFQDDKPSSQLQTDGSFRMKTFPFGDGVPPGKYKVTLGDEVASRLSRPDLSEVEKTPWTIDVTDAGVSDHVFSVE